MGEADAGIAGGRARQRRLSIRRVASHLGAGVLVLVHAVEGQSWATSRSPAEWNVQMGVGVAILPFEKAWSTATPLRSEADDRTGSMGALALRAAGGWTAPSGRWGLDVGVSGGPRPNFLEPEENGGSFFATQVVFRWDPFANYQIAPFGGLGAAFTSAEQKELVGAGLGGFFGDRDEAWGLVEQERQTISWGLTSGLRMGWFEMQTGATWPLLSRETQRRQSLDASWSGEFAPVGTDMGFEVGMVLRLPLRALDRKRWEERRRLSDDKGRSEPKPNTFSLGVAWFQVPPAWEAGPMGEEIGGGACQGVRLRWDVSRTPSSKGGGLLGVFLGQRRGDGMASRESQDPHVVGEAPLDTENLVAYGGEAGVWWEPLEAEVLPLRLSGTLGYWCAKATAIRSNDARTTSWKADWSGARASIGGRLALGLVYGGAHLDLDVLRAGRARSDSTEPVIARTAPVAVAGGVDAGFLYRF